MVSEFDLQGGIQGDGERYFILVGLPDKAVQESKERVRTAIRNSGWIWPAHDQARVRKEIDRSRFIPWTIYLGWNSRLIYPAVIHI